MEHTVNSLRATSNNYYPRIGSNVSELCFQSRVLESTVVDQKQRYTIEYQQSHAERQVGPRQRTGQANITINYVRHQASTATFQSCDIDKITIGHQDCVFQIMTLAGMLYHLKILCKELGICHLTYGKDDSTSEIGGFLPLLGFKRCACTDKIGPSRCCIAIPSARRVGEEVPPNDRAQGAKMGANVMHSAPGEHDLSTMTCSLDRGDKFQKHQPRPDKKVYCTHWLSKGNCAYMQQGCIYKHKIPKDQETWESLGFNTLPGWLQGKSSAWINQHLLKSPKLAEDLYAEGSDNAMRSQSQISTLKNHREDGDRLLAYGMLRQRPDSTDLRRLSSSDKLARPSNERAHPSSTDITRKRARNDCDDVGHTTRKARRPRYHKNSLPAHAKNEALESRRLHSTDSIDDPGYHMGYASRGGWENSPEPSHQPPLHWLTASAGSSSGASCGYDYGEDPVLQASQFLGDWQIETPDVVWGSYPSHGSYPSNQPRRPGRP